MGVYLRHTMGRSDFSGGCRRSSQTFAAILAGQARSVGAASTRQKGRTHARLNLLDENFPDDQRSLLRLWRIPFQEIGRHAGRFGIKDDNIIPLLHRLRQVTFFTQDEDFFRHPLCHSAYCLVWLDTRADDAGYFTRRFLRHPRFNTITSRMGAVVRVHMSGIHFWRRHARALQREPWAAQ